MKRPIFAPSGWLDRILYMLLCLSGPTTVIATMNNPELRFASFVMAVWTLIAVFYTIDWAIGSYRKHFKKRPPNIAAHQ